MADLEARSGLKARTIRDYIRQGFLLPPRGHGLAAVYDEEQLLRITFIARMRAKREGWDVIGERLGSWSLKKLRAFCDRTDSAGGRRRGRARSASPGSGDDDGARGAGRRPADGLPGGASFVMAPVLPGLALLLRHDAAPLVKRIAAEILAKYAATG